MSERGIEWRLRELCQQHGMPIMAYSPLHQGALIAQPKIGNSCRRSLASRRRSSRSRGFSRKRNTIAIPQSSNVDHVAQFRAAADVRLSPDALAEIDAAFPPPQARTAARHPVAARSSAGAPILSFTNPVFNYVYQLVTGGGTLAAKWWSPGLASHKQSRQEKFGDLHTLRLPRPGTGREPRPHRGRVCRRARTFPIRRNRGRPGSVGTRAHDPRRVRSALERRSGAGATTRSSRAKRPRPTPSSRRRSTRSPSQAHGSCRTCPPRCARRSRRSPREHVTRDPSLRPPGK